MSRTLARTTILPILALWAGLTTSFAIDHLMVIQEVFPGTPSDPSAQYVMLRMTSSGQSQVNLDFIQVQDAGGVVIGRFGTFDHSVAQGGTLGCAYPACPAIVIGTLAAQSRLGFALDQLVDAQAGRVALSLDGGRVCFYTGLAAADCVAWGSFTGSNTIPTPTTNGCDANFGSTGTALKLGFAQTRKQFNCASKENSIDFENRFPHPVANGGGNANADSDADGLINVLDCEDTLGSAGLYPVLGVADLNATGGQTTTYTWSPEPAPAGTSLVYDLSVTTIQELRTQRTCDDAGLAGTFLTGPGVTVTTLQDSTIPAPGEIQYIVVRSRTICGPASFC